MTRPVTVPDGKAVTCSDEFSAPSGKQPRPNARPPQVENARHSPPASAAFALISGHGRILGPHKVGALLASMK